MEYFFFRIKIWKEKSIFTFIYLMCPYFADHTSWSTLFVAYICKRILKIGYLFTIFQVQCMHYLSGFFFLLSVVHSLRLVAYFWRSSMEFPIWFRDIFTHLFVHSYFKLFFFCTRVSSFYGSILMSLMVGSTADWPKFIWTKYECLLVFRLVRFNRFSHLNIAYCPIR